MAPGRARDERKEQQWRRRIAEWRGSALRVRAFCARPGLATPSFYAWRRLIGERDAERSAFVPVRVVPDGLAARAGTLEIVLPGDRIVRVTPGFNAATLRQMLAVLEEEPC
jgi:hypothetical protein